jgi:uncharacterized repeat protein (TIGR03843 family)
VSGRELTLLTEGSIELLGRIPRSSNETFLVQVTFGDDSACAVYKPEAGERPLSDFEPGLCKRERAAYLLSEALGWGFVPLTVIREEAPLGIGSLQWFIESDFQEHYFTLYGDAPETRRELARIALFDYVANNTDRKSGHVLRGDDGRIWGIDHGLCFSSAFKLRTVIWDFAGEPIPRCPARGHRPARRGRAFRCGRAPRRRRGHRPAAPRAAPAAGLCAAGRPHRYAPSVAACLGPIS